MTVSGTGASKFGFIEDIISFIQVFSALSPRQPQ